MYTILSQLSNKYIGERHKFIKKKIYMIKIG